jgi:hypothetical protein
MCGGCQDKHISSSGKPKKMRVKTQFSLHHGQIGVVISEEEHVIRIKFSDGKEELFGRSSVQEVQ